MASKYRLVVMENDLGSKQYKIQEKVKFLGLIPMWLYLKRWQGGDSPSDQGYYSTLVFLDEEAAILEIRRRIEIEGRMNWRLSEKKVVTAEDLNPSTPPPYMHIRID